MTGPTRTAAHDDAWLALALVEGLSPRKSLELVAQLGGPEAVLDASPVALRAHGIVGEVEGSRARARAAAARERERLDRVGASAVTWSEPAYPERLRAIPDPPLALFVRGVLDDARDRVAVAIVGSRRAGEYGRRVAHELAVGLAQAGVTVVSGLAAGIDAAGHRGALAGQGRTIAVMATGIDRVYPAWHASLAREIATSGALVTELCAGAPPLQFHFPKRNRIISGLSMATVVVEAAERSGSLITAQLAAEQGRAVFAVPGPVGMAQHRGCHHLIRHGATLVTSVDQVLDDIAPMLRERLTAARQRSEAATLAPDERVVIEAVATVPATVDALVTQTALAPATVLETLLALELRGLVEQRPGMRFVARRAA